MAWTSLPAGPSRCSRQSGRPHRTRSSRGRRRWPAATAPATAAPSRSAASSSASASKDRCSVLLNASGCLDALTAPDVARALDAFVTKTITPLPRDGNQPVRIAETDAGMLNSIGLQGPGIDGLVDRALPALSRLGLRVWVSVGGFSVDDYAGICEHLDRRAAVEAIDLNLSCPNVEEAPDTAAQIVA